MRETTFGNAKVNDRVYSPLFKSINRDDKTNAIIENITEIFHPLTVRGDDGVLATFCLDGTYSFILRGQVLFWENPIKEIPVRPKRMVIKKWYIGIKVSPSTLVERLAITTNIYASPAAVADSNIGWGYEIRPIEFEMEE